MTLLLGNPEIEQVLDAGLVLDVLDETYRGYHAGRSTCVPRIDVQVPTQAEKRTYQFGVTVGASAEKYLAIRIKSDVTFEEVRDGIRRKEKFCIRPGLYCGLVLLFGVETGELLAILHDGYLQKLRVGADSGVGARYMARSDAAVLGILGSGGMARAHLDAFMRVRPIRRVQIFSPTRENREAFAREAADRHGIEAVAVEAARDVFRGADILAACTNAIGPVVIGDYLEDGTHVTCIGGTLDRRACERVDIALRFGTAPTPVGRPDLVVTEECLTYAVGGRKAAHGGTRRFAEIAEDRCISFGGLLADPALGRSAPEQVTFSERGNIHGLQFYAVAGAVYERAVARGLGREIPTDSFLQTIRN